MCTCNQCFEQNKKKPFLFFQLKSLIFIAEEQYVGMFSHGHVVHRQLWNSNLEKSELLSRYIDREPVKRPENLILKSGYQSYMYLTQIIVLTIYSENDFVSEAFTYKQVISTTKPVVAWFRTHNILYQCTAKWSHLAFSNQI